MRQKRKAHPLLLSIMMLGVLLALSWLPAFSQSPDALAHAFVIGSDPIDGSTVASAPKVVRIYFNADISPASIAHVYAFPPGGPQNGFLVDGARSTVSAQNPRELDTPLLPTSSLPQGGYEVKWTAVAMEDGHTTSGLIGFNIGYSSTGASGQSILGPSTSNYFPALSLVGILAVMWEWLTQVALIFWLGILVMEGLILFARPATRAGPAIHDITRLRKQSLPLQGLCLAALLAGEVINLILRAALLTQSLSNNTIDPAAIGQLLFQTIYGYLWIARMLLIICAAGLLWWILRKQRLAQTRPVAKSAGASRFSQFRQQVAEELEEDEKQPESQKSEANGTVRITSDKTRGEEQRPPASRNAEQTAADYVPRWYTVAWLVLGGLILLTLALSSEEVQLAPQRATGVVLQWLFLAGQAVWFGGIAYLGFILIPTLPIIETDQHGESLVTLLRQYVSLLLLALGALLVSGLFLVETTITGFQQFMTEPYGRALLAKLLLFLLMLAFSLYAFCFLRARLTRQVILLPVVDAELPARRTRRSEIEQTESSLKRTMHILSLLGAGILLCAALMNFFAPPVVFPSLPATINQTGNPPATSPGVQTKQAGNLTATLVVQPAKIGATNTVSVTLKTNNGDPITDAKVQIRINMELMDMGTAQQTAQSQQGSSTYVAVFGPEQAFSMFGAWDIDLSISRPGQAAVQMRFVVTLT
ncbi:MAG TPA: copper resistance protein CopC [Ktedonobacteraceae bacterium]|nr:copper resistance protein CopC [Ktedonobacteraceae bacterium]